uniref:PH domain-containing protein n=1 Tax=Trieres chinensis TaxID=1514140 RepID=A0A7S1Z661_TRICV|mmetsp:Transcript_18368/g.37227  ORF Transcript_18368/g.37227 Transcript_18368/m.37227 type:complete len:214 (+) Transcript_18368:198-839(+)|eukprot:CAMPEP_0183306464 /NCGR_PEP_ID=MMETSP0160_2-20130417/11690_1 /TAXON_ID=2839 ORGANISM="Odontella Sinensis, Strain Grunow 1884" /NCGR_SAMPLE_ID=MMETSP0160_2 /ASSEMBLY_ACC=CAM_ASM_000250 /LENGTH=213 /DNA_ID=CAMNT_0025469837 /DNA_START=163 /DNA_END=804 /DNA_ORIENTATION=+
MTDGTTPSAPQSASSSKGKRRSSFLTRARESFYRSKGERGADVEALRGTRGADFEGDARVLRGSSGGVACGCFGRGGGDGEPKKVRFILIKGGAVFVFSNEDSPAPKYAVPLMYKKVEVHHSTVELQTTLGDVEYKFAFEAEETARKFARIVTEQASIAEADNARKRLGHSQVLNRRASTRYAASIAEKKEKDQPEAPLTATEVMGNMPMPPM